MIDDNDDPPTPAQTPSALHRLGLVVCPKCKESTLGFLCDLCNGGRRVPVDQAIAWQISHGDTDPASKP